MLTENDAFSMAKMAHIIPMVADSEAAAKTSALGASAGAQDGPVEVASHHPRQQPPSMQVDRPARQCGCCEDMGRHRAGLTIPIDDVDDRRTMRRAQEGEGSTTLACCTRPCVACLALLLYSWLRA